MPKIEARRRRIESKINVSDGERRALQRLLREILEGRDVTGDVTIQLGQGGVSDVTLTEVSKAE